MQSEKKSKKPWRCPKCGETKKSCPHLEKELSGVYSKKSVKSRPISYIDAIKTPVVTRIEELELQFRNRVSEYCLPKLHIDVLVLRFVYDQTLADIADELSIPNRQTAFYILQMAKQYLKERGFRLEK